MRLLIIRHGQSEADLLNVHEGRADYALTPLGRPQAQQMARHICRSYRLTHLYTSPLQRARQTAQYLTALCGLPLREDARLMEFDNGLLAGMGREEAAARYPYRPDLPPDQALYGQESRVAFRSRVQAFLAELLARHAVEDCVAVITHGGTINQLYGAAQNLPVDSPAVFLTGDTGLHEWLVGEAGIKVLRANCLQHQAEVKGAG